LLDEEGVERMKRQVPEKPQAEGLSAIAFQVELNPVEKEALPVSVIQVLPLGEVQIRDSRSNFHVTELSVLSILGHFGMTSVDLAIDYDHGMYYGDNNEAAGWGEKVWAIVSPEAAERLEPFLSQFDDRVALLTSEDEAEHGIYVFVRWTEAAAEKIAAREYRYISPVVFFSFTGEAEYLWNAALVNNPAIDGMDALAASALPPKRELVEVDEDELSDSDLDVTSGEAESSAACQNQPDDGTAAEPNSAEENSKEDIMDLKAFAASIRPDLDTEAEDFNAEVFMAEAAEEMTNLRERDEEHTALAAENEQVKADRDEAREALEATGKENVDLREQVAAFEAEGQKAQVEAAIADGRIAESQREWALANFPAFETLLETLGDEQKLGPPQGSAIDAKTEEPLEEGEEFSVESIKAYQKENGLDTFEAAYIALRKASK
jgi:phage I-like protein